MRKPTVDDECGANAYAAWENKIYVTVCGGTEGVRIITVDSIELSFGLELTSEQACSARLARPEIMALPWLTVGSM